MIQIVLLILGLLTVSVGYYKTNHFWFEQSQAQSQAQETASAWNGFAQGLNAYVKQNTGTISGTKTVSCQTLQSDGYYSGSCADPLGETMEGVVAAPYGFPQSWGVIATSTPNPAILGKFGIGNPSNPMEQSLRWHAFLYNVATLLQGDNLVAAVYNGSSQTFKEPFGTAASTYADYSLPATPITYGQTFNGSGPDGLMAFPQLHKQPGYWLWQAQLLDEDSEANISFVNYGYSAVCPPGGITPASWNSPWVINNVTQSYAMWNNPSGTFFSQLNEGYGTNYHQVFVCVPAPESLVNNASSYNPFNALSNNLSNTTTNYDQNNQNYWTGDMPGTTYGQAGGVYYLSIGSQTYSLDAYAGIQGAMVPGTGDIGLVTSLAFYQGNQPNAINYAPDFFGPPQFDSCSTGFCPSPTVTLPSQSIALQ
ncbi:MAG: hypothetical protein ACYCUY_02210 [Acidithiobacillus sp.]